MTRGPVRTPDGAPGRDVATPRRSVVAVAARDLLVLLDGGLRDLGLLAEVRLAELGAQLLGAPHLALDAVLVGRRADLERLVLLVRREGVQRVLAERLVDLDELTVRQALDDARLAAVQHLVPVPSLQAEADPLGGEEGQHRYDEEADAHE